MLNNRHLIFIYYFGIIFLFFGCGVSEKDTHHNNIFKANQLLTTGKCTEALKVLEDITEEFQDYYYFQVKASAYACKANYSDLDLFDELENFNGSQILNSLAKFTTSVETDPESTQFTNLSLAIDVILQSVSDTELKTSDRIAHFGSEKGEDLSFQVLTMIMNYIGKWLYFFGSVDSNGVKGASDGSNGVSCLLNYPNNVVFDTLLDNTTTDSCNSTNGHNAGHPKLDPLDSEVGYDLYAARVCHFIVYFNHLLDIIGNIQLSNNESLENLQNLSSTMITLLENTSDDYSFDTILTLYDQNSCVDYVTASASNQLVVQGYFAALVENNFL